MTTPMDPADVIAKITANIREEVDGFLAALAADADAPAYCREFIDGNTAMFIDRDHIRILPFIEPPAEPDDVRHGTYL